MAWSLGAPGHFSSMAYPHRHPGEGRDPVLLAIGDAIAGLPGMVNTRRPIAMELLRVAWVPAFAGMTN
jgi:hypothetical protein